MDITFTSNSTYVLPHGQEVSEGAPGGLTVNVDPVPRTSHASGGLKPEQK